MTSKQTKPKEQNGDSRVPLGRRERHLVSETVNIEEELLPTSVRSVMIFVVLLLVTFMVWAVVTDLTQVARAPGQIIPSGQNKVVEHVDGGVVTEIDTEEHALVKKGQVLLRIHSSGLTSDLAKMKTRLLALKLQAERLQAFARNRQPNFPQVAPEYQHLVDDQWEIFRNQVKTRDSTLAILARQEEQRRLHLRELRQQLAVARQHQKLTTELAAMREDLGARKLISRTTLLETRRAKVTADGEVERLRDEIRIATQKLQEIMSRHADTGNQLSQQALVEMGKVNADIAELQEGIDRLEVRIGRSEVRAPISGYVQDLRVLTVGQVVQPGALLAEIVPDKAPLQAMVRIAPQDIGYVKLGQSVNLRVTSFDYARFGFAKGVLNKITASSILDENGRPYYRAWVTISHPWVGDRPGLHPLKTGMVVEADIITGSQSMLSYLTTPLTEGLSGSFHER